MFGKGYDNWAGSFSKELSSGEHKIEESYEPMEHGGYDMGNHFAKYYPVYDSGDKALTAVDVEIENDTNIDLDNAVDAAQNTAVTAEIGDKSSVIIDDALQAQPQQSLAVGNFAGDVETGAETNVETATAADDFGWGGYWGGDKAATFADVDISNSTDIEINNDVTAIQNTVIDLDIGDGANVIVSDSLAAAPSQNIAVGNFEAGVETGADTEVDTGTFA